MILVTFNWSQHSIYIIWGRRGNTEMINKGTIVKAKNKLVLKPVSGTYWVLTSSIILWNSDDFAVSIFLNISAYSSAVYYLHTFSTLLYPLCVKSPFFFISICCMILPGIYPTTQSQSSIEKIVVKANSVDLISIKNSKLFHNLSFTL